MGNAMNDRKGDRRTARRFGAGEHGIVAAHVRSGGAVAVVDVSAGGALVEGQHRLIPGALVELHVETSGRRAAVRGRVLRCAVARLYAAAVCYRGAIAFDACLPWFLADSRHEYHLPGAEPGRVGSTPTVL